MRTYQFSYLAFIFLFNFSTLAQQGGDFETTPEVFSYSCDATTSIFKIQGTSSLHDWEMISQACKGTLGVFPMNDKLDISQITVEVQVNSLKSGKKVMDRKCYDALKSEKYPKIVFVLDEVRDLKKIEEANYQAVFRGNLHIAGVKKPVDISVEMTTKENNLHIQGSKSLKLTDFNVEPPKALMGTLKTGNEIEIIFNLNFIQL